MGSPPPLGSKNAVLILRSVSSIVMAPAKTGSERRSRMVVIKTAHTNRGIRSRRMPLIRQLNTVEIKFTDAIIDEAPARCKEKIAKSTDGPA